MVKVYGLKYLWLQLRQATMLSSLNVMAGLQRIQVSLPLRILPHPLGIYDVW